MKRAGTQKMNKTWCIDSRGMTTRLSSPQTDGSRERHHARACTDTERTGCKDGEGMQDAVCWSVGRVRRRSTWNALSSRLETLEAVPGRFPVRASIVHLPAFPAFNDPRRPFSNPPTPQHASPARLSETSCSPASHVGNGIHRWTRWCLGSRVRRGVGWRWGRLWRR